MAKNPIRFYVHTQDTAQSTFPSILRPHLPHSNPLYNRILAPQNTPSRHCVFAASFPPEGLSQPPEDYTITFSDRSRHLESQIWIFNPLVLSENLSSDLEVLLHEHVQSCFSFLKDLPVPEAPGWPFSSLIKFACMHSRLASLLLQLGEAKNAVVYSSEWNLWQISTSFIASHNKERKPLPQGFTVSRVPEDQIDIVISTSAIPRQPSTYLMLPSVGLMNEVGKLVAWGYIGIDGAFTTLFVLPGYRGKGFATYVAMELMERLSKGEFVDMGYDGSTGWVQAEVHEGNLESEAVMKALSANFGYQTFYLWIDVDKF